MLTLSLMKKIKSSSLHNDFVYPLMHITPQSVSYEIKTHRRQLLESAGPIIPGFGLITSTQMQSFAPSFVSVHCLEVGWVVIWQMK